MKKITSKEIAEMSAKTGLTPKSDVPNPPSQSNAIIISGGELVQMGNDVIYYGNNGAHVTFRGVKYEINKHLIAPNTAYQLNGTIHISQSWLDNGFNIYNFAHEYGHYIQEEDMGKLEYYYYALQSMYSLLTDPDNHGNTPFEKQAEELGYNYLINNTTYPGMI